MGKRFEQPYGEEEAAIEAERIKDLVGKSGTNNDYSMAHELIESERQKERTELFEKKTLAVFDTYRKILESLDSNEIKDISLASIGWEHLGQYRQREKKKDGSNSDFWMRSIIGTSERFETDELGNSHFLSPEEKDGYIRFDYRSSSDGGDDLYEEQPGKWITHEGFRHESKEYLRNDLSPKVRQERIFHLYDRLTSLDTIGVFNYHNEESVIDITSPEITKFITDYSDVLKKIEGVKDRQIGHDRQMKLIDNLEHRRKQLHDEAAEELQREMEKDGVLIGIENARHLLALVFEMKKNLLEGNEFDISYTSEEDTGGASEKN